MSSNNATARKYDPISNTAPCEEIAARLAEALPSNALDQKITDFGLVDKFTVFSFLLFSVDKQIKQRRKDKDATPYINRPLAVAKSLVDHGITDQDVVFAALLHDIIEDTQTTVIEFAELFDRAVAGLVMEVADNKSLTKDESKALQVKNEATKSYGARLIKLVGNIHNLQSMISSDPNKWSDERIAEHLIQLTKHV